MPFKNKLEVALGDLWNLHSNDSEQQEFQDFLTEMYDRLNEKREVNLKLVGKGANSSVFWLSDHNKILKLTSDKTDAQASEIIRNKPDKNLVDVYDVFEFGLPYFPARWGIVSKKLTGMSGTEKKGWEAIIDVTRGEYYTPKYQGPKHWTYLTSEWLQEVSEWLSKGQVPPRVQHALETYLPELTAWEKALSTRGLSWGDLSLGNLMKKGPMTVISDLGFMNITSAPYIDTIDV